MVTHAFTPSNICPICKGHSSLPAGTGRRCYGFMGADGKYAHCTREELAFSLEQETNGTYAHKLSGKCKCGSKHQSGNDTSAETIEHEIRDSEGVTLAIHCRIYTADGNKSVWWRQPDGTKRLGGVAVASLPLYGAHKLADLEDGAEIVVTEGEPATDALLDWGIPAVGTVTGAASCPNDKSLAPLVRFYGPTMTIRAASICRS